MGDQLSVVESLEALSDWLVANDHDMQLPDGIEDPRDAVTLILSLQEQLARAEDGLRAAGQAIDYAASVMWIGRPQAIQIRPASIDEALRTFRKARSTLSPKDPTA